MRFGHPVRASRSPRASASFGEADGGCFTSPRFGMTDSQLPSPVTARAASSRARMTADRFGLRSVPPSIVPLSTVSLCSLPRVAVASRRLPDSRTLTQPFEGGCLLARVATHGLTLRCDWDLSHMRFMTDPSVHSSDFRADAGRRRRSLGRAGAISLPCSRVAMVSFLFLVAFTVWSLVPVGRPGLGGVRTRRRGDVC